MEQLDILWDYQKLDTKVDELEIKKKNSAARKELYKAIKYLKTQQNDLVKLNNDIDKKNHIYNRLSHDFESIDKELKVEEETLNSGKIKSFKELEQIEERIRLAEEKLEAKRKELDSLVGDVESLNKRLKKVTLGIRKGKKEYDRYKKEYDLEVRELEEEFSDKKAERKELQEKINKALLEKYKAVKGKHSDAMAQIHDSRCGGCNMALASLVIQNVKNKDKIIECENCGRILYINDDD